MADARGEGGAVDFSAAALRFRSPARPERKVHLSLHALVGSALAACTAGAVDASCDRCGVGLSIRAGTRVIRRDYVVFIYRAARDVDLLGSASAACAARAQFFIAVAGWCVRR